MFFILRHPNFVEIPNFHPRDVTEEYKLTPNNKEGLVKFMEHLQVAELREGVTFVSFCCNAHDFFLIVKINAKLV